MLFTEEYVSEKIRSAKIENEPFPHFMIKDIFPSEFYIDLLANLPINSEFNCDDQYRFNLNLNSEGLNRIQSDRAVFWKQFLSWMSSESFKRTVTSKIYPHLRLRFFTRKNLKLESKISLARNKSGFILGPHTDMAHRVLTLIFYLPQDHAHWEAGTSLYIARDSAFTCSGGPHYEFKNFKKLATVKFMPNTLFGFIKTNRSFHGVEPWADKNFIRDTINYEIQDSDRSHYYN